jgi:hypothetical protein
MMTLTGITRRFRGGPGREARLADLAIGDPGDRVFSCPRCARPLGKGQGRCPGCGTLLVAGVVGRTAMAFIAAGIVIGMIGGAMIAGLALGPGRAVLGAAGSSGATAATAPGGGLADPTAGPVRLPAGTAPGLVEVATLNDRLDASTAALARALKPRHPSSAEIAPLLRRIAADARSGEQAARRIAAWQPAATLADRLTTLYTSLAATATTGLGAPLADNGAYAAAGKRMQKALKGLNSADEMTKAVASLAGVELPGSDPAP